MSKFKGGEVVQKVLKGKGLSHQWQIVLAFFLGGSISSIAQDPSDTLFFWASSHGALNAAQQTQYWYWFPFALYFGLFLLGFAIAKATDLPPTFLVYLYLALVLCSAVVSLMLPQTALWIYVGSVLLGTFISIGIILGLATKVKAGGKK
jgi:hypothetical protein